MLDKMQSYKVTNKSLFLFIYFYLSYFDCQLMLGPQLYRSLWIFTNLYIKESLMSKKPQLFIYFSVRLRWAHLTYLV